MPRRLIFEKETDIENILETTQISGYFFIDYYEMPSGMFYELDKTFPAGFLTSEQLKEELEKLYEENIPYWKEWDERCCHNADICIFIGYFDKDRDFHVVADKSYR